MEQVAEVAALMSAYSYDDTIVVTLHTHHKAVQHLQAGDEQAAAAALDAEPCPAIKMEATCTCSRFKNLQVTLHIVLEPGYPAQPVQSSLSITTADTSGNHDTISTWCQALETELQQLAQKSAAEARMCLLELVAYVQQAVEAFAEQQAADTHADVAAHATETKAPALTAGADSEGGLQQLVVKLDHMHNKAMYIRTLRAWMSQLGITGRLVFHGNKLIVLLLEGSAAQLKQYLVKHRTETVDVDSRGRKCRERMMTIVLQRPAAAQKPTHGDYREIDAPSIAELTDLIHSMRLSDMTRDILTN